MYVFHNTRKQITVYKKNIDLKFIELNFISIKTNFCMKAVCDKIPMLDRVFFTGWVVVGFITIVAAQDLHQL